MATSSFSREFVVSDPAAVDKLIRAMENPVKIKLKKRDAQQEAARKRAILCNLDKRLVSTKS